MDMDKNIVISIGHNDYWWCETLEQLRRLIYYFKATTPKDGWQMGHVSFLIEIIERQLGELVPFPTASKRLMDLEKAIEEIGGLLQDGEITDIAQIVRRVQKEK